MPIVLIGQAGTGSSTGGSFPSPGPTVSYASLNGNTLIVAGGIESTAAITGITSITDSAGNAWQYSTSNNQNPPSVVADTTHYFCTFVGWCIDAAAVTSVTVTGNVGNSSNWLVSVSEWNGISVADNGVALTGTNANPGGTVDLTYAGELVVGNIDNSSDAISPSALPHGWTAFRFLGSHPVYAGWTMPGAAGFYTANWTMPSDTYAVVMMSFSSTGAVASPPPGMRAF